MGVQRKRSESIPGDAAMRDVRELIHQLTEESELTVHDESPYPADTVFSHRPGTVVQSVRLDVSDLDEIKSIAARTNVPCGALLRSWIKEGLATEKSASIDNSIERLTAELNRLRRVAKQ